MTDILCCVVLVVSVVAVMLTSLDMEDAPFHNDSITFLSLEHIFYTFYSSVINKKYYRYMP